ncbi:hypothetical protein UlMin_040453 [Ulmus minor]
MEKACDFCRKVVPVVYCQADFAHLCLSCDRKVHSHNNIASKHVRTLLCDHCRCLRPSVLCFDHQMFMCPNCDAGLHEFLKHQKQAIKSSYIACPSAKEFASQWGFKLSEPDNSSDEDQFMSSILDSGNSSAFALDNTTVDSSSQTGGLSVEMRENSPNALFFAQSEESDQHLKTSDKDQHQQIIHIALEQILQLDLSKEKNPSPIIHGQQQTGTSSSVHQCLEQLDENLDQPSQHYEDFSTGIQQLDNPTQELNIDPFPFPFSQLENSPSSLTSGVPPNGELFWSSTSTIPRSQDDINIPDMDLTFQSIEEFGAHEDPKRVLLDDKDESFSSMEKHSSIDKFDTLWTEMESESSMDKDTVFNHTPLIGPCSSSMSQSNSMFSAESGGQACSLDSGLSSYMTEGSVDQKSLQKLDPEAGRKASRELTKTRSWLAEQEGQEDLDPIAHRELAKQRYKEKRKKRIGRFKLDTLLVLRSE